MTETDHLEMLALAPGRRRMYAFQSAAFLEPPTGDGLSAFLNDEFLDSAGVLLPNEALTALRQYAGRAAELQRDAPREFMNLFKVPGAQYVTPYESVFRDTRDIAGKQVKGLLLGPSAVDVQKWYRLAALEISDEYRDLPDHIGLELNYLAHLTAKEQKFAAGDDEAKLTRTWEMERDFLAGHVVQWIGALRDKVRQKSKHHYFRAVADMGVEFTRRDLATLEGLLGPSSGRSAPEYGEIES